MKTNLREVRKMMSMVRSARREVRAEILSEKDGMYTVSVGGLVWGGISEGDLDFVLTGEAKV